MFVLRTWSNGWLTTNRMHDVSKLPCIFGCDGECDTLHHYLRCEPLWTLVYTCAKSNSIQILQQSAEDRFCIQNLSSANFIRLYCAFSLYHHLRKHMAEQLENCVSLNDWSEVYEAAIQLIKAFYEECRPSNAMT